MFLVFPEVLHKSPGSAALIAQIQRGPSIPVGFTWNLNNLDKVSFKKAAPFERELLFYASKFVWL
jgi:hypothetical protein